MAKMAWQPMKDFPICRERVLIYDPQLGVRIAYFETGRGWTLAESQDRTWPKPTAWMPMPDPPRAQEQ